MTDYERILRDVNLAGSMQPAEMLLLLEDMRQVVMRGGKINPKAAQVFRTPRRIDYTVGTTLPLPADQAGILLRVSVRCGTAPSTGDAHITITRTSDLNGIETYVVTVPEGDSTGYLYPNEPVNATDWFGIAVTDAEGASGISATITIGGS